MMEENKQKIRRPKQILKSQMSKKEFTERLKKLDCKNRIIVEEHHELLPQMESCNMNNIIHVDYHQDICYATTGYPTVHEISCGTFFYFLKNKKKYKIQMVLPI